MNRIIVLTVYLSIWVAGVNVLVSLMQRSIEDLAAFPTTTVEEARSSIAETQRDTVPSAEIKSSDADH